MRNKKTIKIIAVGAVLALLASLVPLHFIIYRMDGFLLWNSEEAYFFASSYPEGYRLNCLQYMVTYVLEYFGSIRQSDDARSVTTVIRITPARIDNFVARDIAFRSYLPVGKNIYAWDGGPLWKWTGTQFEEASPEEKRDIISAPNVTLAASQKDFDNHGGWSARHSFANWPPKLTIRLGEKQVLFSAKLGDWVQGIPSKVLIDLNLSNGTAQRLVYSDPRLRLVSKDEYNRTFGKPR